MIATRSWQALLVWLVLCFAVAGFGAQFSPGEWYAGLAKPAWTPPDWVFAPVWTLLYTLMAIAAWLVWKQQGFSGATVPLTLFIVQLLLNGLWSWLFFGLQRIGFGLIDIVLLWGLLGATVVVFWRRRSLAGGLLLPYWVWVSYAVSLNAGIWFMNPQ